MLELAKGIAAPERACSGEEEKKEEECLGPAPGSREPGEGAPAPASRPLTCWRSPAGTGSAHFVPAPARSGPVGNVVPRPSPPSFPPPPAPRLSWGSGAGAARSIALRPLRAGRGASSPVAPGGRAGGPSPGRRGADYSSRRPLPPEEPPPSDFLRAVLAAGPGTRGRVVSPGAAAGNAGRPRCAKGCGGAGAGPAAAVSALLPLSPPRPAEDVAAGPPAQRPGRGFAEVRVLIVCLGASAGEPARPARWDGAAREGKGRGGAACGAGAAAASGEPCPAAGLGRALSAGAGLPRGMGAACPAVASAAGGTVLGWTRGLERPFSSRPASSRVPAVTGRALVVAANGIVWVCASYVCLGTRHKSVVLIFYIYIFFFVCLPFGCPRNDNFGLSSRLWQAAGWC